jgi:hypothetical protein
LIACLWTDPNQGCSKIPRAEGYYNGVRLGGEREDHPNHFPCNDLRLPLPNDEPETRPNRVDRPINHHFRTEVSQASRPASPRADPWRPHLVSRSIGVAPQVIPQHSHGITRRSAEEVEEDRTIETARRLGTCRASRPADGPWLSRENRAVLTAARPRYGMTRRVDGPADPAGRPIPPGRRTAVGPARFSHRGGV